MWGAASWLQACALTLYVHNSFERNRHWPHSGHPSPSSCSCTGWNSPGSTTLKAWLTDRHLKQKRLPRDSRGTTPTRWKWSNNKVLAFFLVQIFVEANLKQSAFYSFWFKSLRQISICTTPWFVPDIVQGLWAMSAPRPATWTAKKEAQNTWACRNEHISQLSQLSRLAGRDQKRPGGHRTMSWLCWFWIQGEHIRNFFVHWPSLLAMSRTTTKAHLQRPALLTACWGSIRRIAGSGPVPSAISMECHDLMVEKPLPVIWIGAFSSCRTRELRCAQLVRSFRLWCWKGSISQSHNTNIVGQMAQTAGYCSSSLSWIETFKHQLTCPPLKADSAGTIRPGTRTFRTATTGYPSSKVKNATMEALRTLALAHPMGRLLEKFCWLFRVSVSGRYLAERSDELTAFWIEDFQEKEKHTCRGITSSAYSRGHKFLRIVCKSLAVKTVWCKKVSPQFLETGHSNHSGSIR